MSAPVLTDSITTKVKFDTNTPGIRDVTVLEVEGVPTTIITDWDNMCVKSFYSSQNKPCHSRLQLNNQPWGITQLGDNKVMVTGPSSCLLVTVAVTPDLLHISTVNTSKGYYSLACLGPSSIAACSHFGVDILNMQGEVTKSVSTTWNLFSCPYYMCVSNSGHLLVSDCLEKTVTRLTSTGDIAWVYAGAEEGKLSFPRGISTTGGGDILVANWDVKKVIQLSESGEYVGDVLTKEDGLKSPWGISVDQFGDITVISNKLWILKFKFTRE